MVKQTRDAAFEAEQFAGVHLPHVTAVNQLVESLLGAGASCRARLGALRGAYS